MSEENIDINIEQILAAILNKIGKVTLSIEALVSDYSEYSVAIDQEENGDLSFRLAIDDESR